MALTLTEEIIRNRVNLQHDNLEDVKALSLPGTYHEKVVCLGNSLKKFSRLKCLDLSRNAVASLQGLEHLKLLEKLNLYYNSIETMEELKRLRFNTNLKELDLRLNPITRTEPDYRLYMIHMLPYLQNLDDRGVRDRERQAALVHFSSSQATEMTHHQREVEPEEKQHPNSRAKMVKGVGKGISALDDDDVAVLDLIARTGGDLSRPRPITGSNAREDDMQEYSLDVLKSMDSELLDDRRELREERPPPPPVEIDERLKGYVEKYPNIPVVNVTSHDDMQSRHDANLQYEDEAEAYNKYKSHGYFTPNPESDHFEQGDGPLRDASADPPRVPTERRRSFGEDEDKHRRSNSAPPKKTEEDFGIHRVNGTDSAQDDSRITNGTAKGMASETPEYRAFLLRILDLVDRYWNGSKSLHKHAKFKALAYGVIENYTKSDNDLEERHQLKGHLKRVQDENYRLRKNQEISKANLADSTVNETQLKNSLTKAYKDVEELKEKLQKYMSENRKLSFRLKEMEETQHSTLGTISHTQLDDVQRQNEILKSEIEMLQIRLKQFGQVQELASMLQESHKSLVQTNGHLLKEMEETKRRHHHEVQQLNWSYEQLKKSMNFTRDSASVLRDGLSRNAGPYSRQADQSDTERMSGSALFYSES